MNVYGVIMAGGGGTRFWPLSRQSRPKQLLNLSGKDLMINETIDRISSVIPKKDIFIVTNKLQFEAMYDATKLRIRENHILKEPTGRNTAACIGYAAMEIIKKYGDGVMCIFPSDHYIKDELTFSNILEKAIHIATNKDVLVTMGIAPTFPATGYGYIRYSKCDNVSKPVIEFKEKPDFDTAKKYVESGEYAWNSGMFVWKASLILEMFKIYLPEIYECLIRMGNSMNTSDEIKTIDDIYPKIPSISIDYGIMEKANNVEVIPASFGWNDVGSFDNLDSIYEKDHNGSIIKGEYIGVESADCVIMGEDKLICTIGMKDTIVVDTKDAILVCDKSKAQDVKKAVDILKEKGYYKYI